MRKTENVYIRSLNLRYTSEKPVGDGIVSATIVYDLDTKEFIVSFAPEKNSWRFRTYNEAKEKADEIFLFWEKAADAIINFEGFGREKK